MPAVTRASITSRVPPTALGGLVRRMWVCREQPGSTRQKGDEVERVLPSSDVYLVCHLGGRALRVQSASQVASEVVGCAVLGGPRTAAYLRHAPRPEWTVGVALRPGAFATMFGVPASEVVERHIALEELWGRDAGILLERLASSTTVEAQLDLLEHQLCARAVELRLDPVIAHALRRFESTRSVAAVAREIGYSHTWFIERFRRAVGLAPKLYCGLRRFNQALEQLQLSRDSLAAIALRVGYSDHAHLDRDFRRFAGIPPSQSRRAASSDFRHLSVGSEARARD